MVQLRFSGLAKTSKGTSGKIIERITGYRVIQDGDDWVVPADDPKLIDGPSPVLYRHPKHIAFTPGNFSEIADIFIKEYLIDFFEKKLQADGPRDITVFSGFGLNTDLVYHKYHFFFLNQKELKTKLIKEIFPFMEGQLGVKKVCPVKADAEYFTGILSLNKIALLTKKFGIDTAQELVLNKRALESIIPSSIDYVKYLEGLLVISSFAFSLPFHRVGSSLHLFSDGLWFFPSEGLKGIYQSLIFEPSILSENRLTVFLSRKSIGSRGPEIFFSLAIDGLNNLSKFLNDPRNFIDDSGVVDHEKIIQTQSSVNLLMNDLLSMQMTNSLYLRQRIAFAYIDKMANLKFHYYEIKDQTEDELFKYIFSYKYGESVAKIFRFHFTKINENLGRYMYGFVLDVYRQIHNHIRGKFWEGGESEDRRLEHIRCLRNTHHGAFLRREQFEEAFYTTSATIPPEIIYLPWLLTWGFILEPKRFMSIR